MTAEPAAVRLRIPVRQPFHGRGLLQFLAARAVPGVEVVDGDSYARTIRLPSGPAAVVLTMPEADAADGTGDPADGTGDAAVARLYPAAGTVLTADDTAAATAACRHLIDADADAEAIAATLHADRALAPVAAAAPGVRVPGCVDGAEIVFRALVGQQISVAAARTALAKLTVAADERVACVIPGLTHLFPSPSAVAELGVAAIAGPRRRAAAIAAAARDLACGDLRVDASRNHADLTAALVSRPGIGPWTAGYVAMRVLREPDILLTGDLALRHGAARLGLPDEPRRLADYAECWRPYRSYAGMYLWRALAPERTAVGGAGGGVSAGPTAGRSRAGEGPAMTEDPKEQS